MHPAMHATPHIPAPPAFATLGAVPPPSAPAGTASPGTPTPGIADLWMALIVIIGLVLVVMSLRRRTEKRIEASEGAGLARLDELRKQARERFGAGAAATPAGEANPARDMEELAERLSAQLDAKADRLERLIARAETRIVELQAGLAAARSPSTQVEPKPEPRAEGRAAARAPVPPEPAGPPQHARVLELADRGLSAVEIARTLEMPTGQVQLILNLRKAPSAL